jgi:hypothetical protein
MHTLQLDLAQTYIHLGNISFLVGNIVSIIVVYIYLEASQEICVSINKFSQNLKNHQRILYTKNNDLIC